MKDTARKAAAGLCVLVCAALTVSLPLAGCTVRKTAEYCTVSYDRGNISQDAQIANWPENEKVQRQERVKEPSKAPEAEGYFFDAWYTTSSATVTYDFKSCIEQDTTIYAHWIRTAEEGPEPEPEPGPAEPDHPEDSEETDSFQKPVEIPVSTPDTENRPGDEDVQDPDIPAQDPAQEPAEDPAENPADSPDGSNGEPEEYPEPQDADIILFAGQSNMAGRGEYASYQGVTTSVEEGHGYAYDMLSRSLGTIREPFGASQNGTGTGYMSETTKSGSMVSAFVESYYAETGRPVVAVSASQGGSPVKAWTKGGAYCQVSGQTRYCNYYQDTLERLEGAVQCVDDSQTLALHAVYMVWLQGETDGSLGTSAEEYESTLDAVYTNLSEDLEAATYYNLDHLYIIPIGTYEGNSEETAANYDAIRNAQQDMCSSRAYADCISLGMQDLTSSGTDKYLKSDNQHVHLTQPGYELLGKDAGSNMGKLVMGQDPVLQRYDIHTESWFVPMEDVAPIPPSDGVITPPDTDTDAVLPPEDNTDTDEVPPAEDNTPGAEPPAEDEGGEVPPEDTEEGGEQDPAGELPGSDEDEGIPSSGEDETVPGEGEDEVPGEGAEDTPDEAEVPGDEEQDPNAVKVEVDLAGNMISLDAWDNEVQTLGSVLVLPDNYDILTDRTLLGWYYTTDGGHSYTKVTALTKVQNDMVIVPYFSNEFYNLAINNRDNNSSHVQDAGPAWGTSPAQSYDNKFVTSAELNTEDYSEDLTISWTGADPVTDGVWFRLLTHFTLSNGSIPQDYYNVFYELTNHGTEEITVTIFFCTSGYPGLASIGGDADNILASAVATVPAGQTVQVIIPHMLYTSEHSYQNFPTAIMIGDYNSSGNRLSAETHTYTDFELGFELGMYYSNTLTFASMADGSSISADYLAVSGSVVSLDTEAGVLTVCKGNSILLPDASYITAPEGYAFEGWYLDADCTRPAGASVSVYEDTTVYANWTPVQD